MTGVTYRLKQRDHELILRFPVSIRLVLSGIALVVFAAMVAGRAFLTFPVVLILLCLAAALYDERWVFDTHGREARRSIGFLFAGRMKTVPFSDIEALTIDRFVKGSPARFPREKVADFRRHHVAFALRLRSGMSMNVESRPSDHALDLAEMVREIGDATGIPVEQG